MVERTDIEFEVTDGLMARGWHFRPQGDGPFPTVVAGEGMAGVKEVALDDVGRHLAEAGIATVAFDYPGFGSSDGEPRQLIDPEQQIATYRAALRYACTRPDVDPARLGAWGASFAGGHVLRLASTESPLVCAVAVVPHTGAGLSQVLDGVSSPRKLVAAFKPRITVVSPDRAEPALMQDREGYTFLTTTTKQRAPHWQNWIDRRSLPLIVRYRPLATRSSIRIPLRAIVAVADHITPPQRAEARLRGEDRTDIVRLPGGHFDIYGVNLTQMLDASTEFFSEHLTPEHS